MIADMDASSTIGAAETGAIFKYGLIWFMILLIIPLYFVQETSGRIGVATEKGLGEVIRDNYSHKIAVITTLPMVLTDVVTYIIEYLGIAIGLSFFGVPIIFSLPIFYIIHLTIVIRRKYGATESILVAVSAFLIVAFMATLVVRGIKSYNPVYLVPSPSFLFMLAVNVGAVIMPFMLFFQASATAEKVSHIRKSNGDTDISGDKSNGKRSHFTQIALKSMRMETLFGAIVSEMLMVIVEMAMSGINPDMDFASIPELSKGLSAIAGVYSPYIFGIGLIGAAFLALVVISLGSAWGFMEALGIKREKSSIVYILESLPAVIIALIIPATLLINTVLDLLVVFVFVLIGPGVLMGVIARNRSIMGDYSTSRKGEIAYWASMIFVLVFGILALT
ncbi:MAG: divalent metal cation transporter [Thermoplasmatales archaeon]|nr:divalent metal cation transporter [Thermoplasmatales archaeon]MCW6170461.1 divalent metal cation transporter [Thermoplasmatales archaeon]